MPIWHRGILPKEYYALGILEYNPTTSTVTSCPLWGTLPISLSFFKCKDHASIDIIKSKKNPNQSVSFEIVLYEETQK